VLTSIFIAVVNVICVVGLALVGIELTLRPPGTSSAKWRIRALIGLFSAILIGFTIWSTVRGERQSSDLPKQLAEYLRNTTPPVFPTESPREPFALAPPTGLVGAVDGDLGGVAIDMGDQILNFLKSEGPAPVRRRGESDIDFVTRSNQWYSNLMRQYKLRFSAQVITLVQNFNETGVLSGQVVPLAEDPVNALGVHQLATELQSGGKRYREKYGPKPH
jgi:hypothetical protein